MAEKIFFNKGDVVRIDLDGSPEMMVIDVDKLRRDDGASITSIINGIKCMWFDGTGRVCDRVFDFKDLNKVR